MRDCDLVHRYLLWGKNLAIVSDGSEVNTTPGVESVAVPGGGMRHEVSSTLFVC